MDSYQAASDYVTEEKAIAISNFRRRQNLKSLLAACLALSPLFFALSRSFTLLPTAARLSDEFSRQVQAVAESRLCVLSIVIVLLGAILCLYRQNDYVDNGGARSADYHHEFNVRSVYSETATTPNCRTVVVDGVVNPETETTPDEEEKQMLWDVYNDEVVTETKSGCVVPPVRAITGTNCTESDEALVEKRYRRTQSESFEKKRVVEKSKSSKRVMQRSETEIIHRKTACCGLEEPEMRSSSVVEWNDEEMEARFNSLRLAILGLGRK